MYISIGSDPASDSWGFVGVVRVGEVEAFRTLEAFATPDEASAAAQHLIGSVLGELLAGREWRQVADQTGRAPRREDFAMGAFKFRRHQREQNGEPDASN